MDGSEPMTSKPKVLIVGAGAAGIALAILLRKKGMDNLRIIEKGDEVGGTWRENRYPGVACDVPSHHYNFSFEHNPAWSARLASGPELQDYMVDVCAKYDLRKDIVFGHEVEEARFDGSLWHIRTAQGLEDSAEFLVAATGPLHRPVLPDIPGLSEFEGEAFHSARWPDDIDLSNKRVGVIGTGSTGTQLISALGKRGVDLTVFMRTPQWIFPLANRKYRGWERALVKRIPLIGRTAGRFFQWFFERVFAEAVIKPGWQRSLMQKACRWNLSRVQDPVLREKLTPDYEPMCKRLVMSVDFYPAVSQSNVEVLRESISSVEPDGVVDTAGLKHEIDVLIMATGFDTRAYFRPMSVINDENESIDSVWSKQTAAHLSTHVPGFPNFMILGGPQSPRGNFSAIAYSEAIAEHIVDVVSTAYDKRWKSIEAKPAPTERFVQSNWDRLPETIWVTGCSSWYQDENGVPETWTGSPDEFRDVLREWDAQDFRVTT